MQSNLKTISEVGIAPFISETTDDWCHSNVLHCDGAMKREYIT